MCDKLEMFAKNLLEQKIQTRRFFYPLHLQPCYSKSDVNIRMKEKYPISEMVYNRGISLPSSYNLDEKQQTEIIKRIGVFFSKNQ